MNIADLFAIAKKIDNYEKDATGATALWPSTTVYKAEVPANKRWFLIGGAFNRDVSSTASFYLKDSVDQVIGFFNTYSAGTGWHRFPLYNGVLFPHGCIGDAGDYFTIEFGTAQGASAEASCMVLEVSV